MHDVCYPAKLVQINIMVVSKPPKPNLKEQLLNQTYVKNSEGGFGSFTSTCYMICRATDYRYYLKLDPCR